MIVERMDTEGEDDRLGFGVTHGHRSHVKRGRLIGLAHVACPFRVEVKAPLYTRLFRFGRLETPVTRVDVTFQNQLTIGECHGIHRSGLHEPDRSALNGPRNGDLVTTLRQDHIIEAGPGHERA